MKSRRIFTVSVLVVIMMSMTSVLSAMELERGTMTDLKQIEKSDMISVARINQKDTTLCGIKKERK